MATAVTSKAEATTEASQEKGSTPNGNIPSKPGPPSGPPQYTAFGLGRQRLILGIVTAAGFFGPLAAGIYLPALPTLQDAFNASATAINATVSVFMGVLAVAVSITWLKSYLPATAYGSRRESSLPNRHTEHQILVPCTPRKDHANIHSSLSSGALKQIMAVASLYTWSP